ncbi:hypothetical protein B0H19DRAFT_1249556 [Mycena capillaripes]|nr:hypothetical protein B0H19DRAFT_1249556 [Mycena capillaripes]
MPGILSRVRGRLPISRQLVYREFNHHQPCPAFDIVPLLSEASIRSKVPMTLSWVQLKRLFIHDTLEPLKSTANLVELTFSIYRGTVHLSLRWPAVLPHLRRLLIYEGDLLRNLVCPALEDLHLMHDNSMVAIPFIERSACRLRTFTSECEILTPLGVISILNLVPTLVKLRRVRALDDTTLLPHLVIPRDDETFHPLGPELRALSLTLDNIDEERVCAAFGQMMESRHKSLLCPALSLCVLNVRNLSRVHVP